MASDPSTPQTTAIAQARIIRVEGGAALGEDDDCLAVEEPLEIRLEGWRGSKRWAQSISITMRTPGEDLSLALGFLRTEGVIGAMADVEALGHCGPGSPDPTNVVKVSLNPGVEVDLKALSRHVYTTSSCGICGKASLEAVHAQDLPDLGPGPIFRAEAIHQLPALLLQAQETFARTGGLHGAALVDGAGQLLAMEEDIGRHNAVDKVIGVGLSQGIPFGQCWLVVSGRAGFELVQKALVVGIPGMVAVGAPSSLAVDLAKSKGMTLLGFVRHGRFNIYSGAERVALSATAQAKQGATHGTQG